MSSKNDSAKVLLPIYDDSKRKHNVELQISYESCSSDSVQNMTLTITNKDDPLFLFILKLSEENFQLLKIQQGLLIEFSLFPSKLSQLLHVVTDEDTKPAPKFVAFFSRETARNYQPATLSDASVLEIVESNPFKHLVHLALVFRSANEEQLRTHLVQSIGLLKSSYVAAERQLQSTIADLQRRVQQLQTTVNEKETEVELLSSEIRCKADSLNAGHSQELERERQRSANKLDQLRSELEQHFSQQIRALERRLRENEAESTQTSIEYQKCKDELSDCHQHLEQEQSQSFALKDRVHETEQIVSVKEQLLSDCQKEKNHFEAQYLALMQELQDNELVANRSQEMSRSLLEQKLQLEATLRNRASEAKELLKKYNQQKQDLKKSMEVIRALEEKVAVLQKKAETRGHVAVEQEKVIEEKDSRLADLEQKLQTSELRCEELTKQKEALEREVDVLKEKAKVLEQNQSMLQLMTTQLQDLRFGQQSSSTLNEAEVPRAYKPVLTETNTSVVASPAPRPVWGVNNFGTFDRTQVTLSNFSHGLMQRSVPKDSAVPAPAPRFMELNLPATACALTRKLPAKN